VTPPPDAVVLYGPPAAGKDTVTAALADLDRRYQHFQRLKVGSGRTAGYRPASADDLARLHDAKLVVYENTRYGNTYAVDRPGLDEIVTAGRVPVVHLGQTAGIAALRNYYPARWLTVLLWCPREVCLARLRQRGSTDLTRRLQAWDETRADLSASGPDQFAIVVRTDRREPAAVADAVHHALTREEPPTLRDPVVS
jgi:guanylate kinase